LVSPSEAHSQPANEPRSPRRAQSASRAAGSPFGLNCFAPAGVALHALRHRTADDEEQEPEEQATADDEDDEAGEERVGIEHAPNLNSGRAHWGSLTRFESTTFGTVHLEDGDLLVGRAWRWSAEQIRIDIALDRADKLARGVANPAPAISVFAVRHPEGEAEVTEATLKGSVRESRNAKWLSVVGERELTEHGFDLVRSEPPQNHHDLVLPDGASDHTIELLESIFNTRERVRL